MTIKGWDYLARWYPWISKCEFHVGDWGKWSNICWDILVRPKVVDQSMTTDRSTNQLTDIAIPRARLLAAGYMRAPVTVENCRYPKYQLWCTSPRVNLTITEQIHFSDVTWSWSPKLLSTQTIIFQVSHQNYFKQRLTLQGEGLQSNTEM